MQSNTASVKDTSLAWASTQFIKLAGVKDTSLARSLKLRKGTGIMPSEGTCPT
jgi:hypothetical protein